MPDEQKNVLVTGSSRGIGKAIALRLAASGWKVAIHYANAVAEAEAVSDLLGSSSLGIFQADLLNQSSANELWSEVTAKCHIHALVNNAGIYEPISILGASDSDFAKNARDTFNLNLFSPLTLMLLASQYFNSKPPVNDCRGIILNVASRVGFRGEPNASNYAASKAALINYTRSLAVELAPAKIRLHSIAPGWVETAMAREGMDERLPEIVGAIPLGRVASPEDCANVAAFLMSTEAAYLSGVVIDINGASYFH